MYNDSESREFIYLRYMITYKPRTSRMRLIIKMASCKYLNHDKGTFMTSAGRGDVTAGVRVIRALCVFGWVMTETGRDIWTDIRTDKQTDGPGDGWMDKQEHVNTSSFIRACVHTQREKEGGEGREGAREGETCVRKYRHRRTHSHANAHPNKRICFHTLM